MVSVEFLLFLALNAAAVIQIEGFVIKTRTSRVFSSTLQESSSESSPTTFDTPKPSNGPRICYCVTSKSKSATWKKRIHLDDLKIGQKLEGYVIQEKLDGKTGPKLWFECGVGRTLDPEGQEWRTVSGMLRLPRSKISVSRKRAARLRKKDSMPLYVTRIQDKNGRIEVCLEPEEVESIRKKIEIKRSASSLKVGEEVIGTVVKLFPFGALVDIGANKCGLLHIQAVADLYGRFINKEKGLVEAGLERGARVRLVVSANEKRQLSLDFTDDVKQESEEEEAAFAQRGVENVEPEDGESYSDTGMSEEELAAWGQFAEQAMVPMSDTVAQEEEENDKYEYEEDEYDDYDLQNDIEDSLGLGSY